MNPFKLPLRALILCGAVAMAPSIMGACGSDQAASGDATSTGDTTSGSGGATGVAAATGSGSGGGGIVNPLVEPCETLCGYIDQINCTAWPKCPSDCPSALGAPPDCIDEYAALLDCWLDNLSEFACTAIQLLPPFACYELDASFLQCLAGQNGGADSGCSGQVCNGTDATCSCKTFCGEAEYKSACSEQATGSWACSCYDGDNLLGTCNQTSVGCDNYDGCCAAYFVAP